MKPHSILYLLSSLTPSSSYSYHFRQLFRPYLFTCPPVKELSLVIVPPFVVLLDLLAKLAHSMWDRFVSAAAHSTNRWFDTTIYLEVGVISSQNFSLGATYQCFSVFFLFLNSVKAVRHDTGNCNSVYKAMISRREHSIHSSRIRTTALIPTLLSRDVGLIWTDMGSYWRLRSIPHRRRFLLEGHVFSSKIRLFAISLESVRKCSPENFYGFTSVNFCLPNSFDCNPMDYYEWVTFEKDTKYSACNTKAKPLTGKKIFQGIEWGTHRPGSKAVWRPWMEMKVITLKKLLSPSHYSS